jgi:hypothetical protein
LSQSHDDSDAYHGVLADDAVDVDSCGDMGDLTIPLERNQIGHGRPWSKKIKDDKYR